MSPFCWNVLPLDKDVKHKEYNYGFFIKFTIFLSSRRQLSIPFIYLFHFLKIEFHWPLLVATLRSLPYNERLMAFNFTFVIGLAFNLTSGELHAPGTFHNRYSWGLLGADDIIVTTWGCDFNLLTLARKKHMLWPGLEPVTCLLSLYPLLIFCWGFWDFSDLYIW